MKYTLFIICLLGVIMAFMPSKAEASGYTSGVLEVNKDSTLSPLASIYNQLINAAKNNIVKVMNKLKKPVSVLLASFMTFWLIIMATRSIITGNSIRDALLSKLGLFIGLSIFLQFNYFSTYIVANAENLFDNLPTYITTLGGGSNNLLQNILSSSETTIKTIGNILIDASFSFGYILSLIGGILALVSIIVVTIKVICTSLVATIKFYLVLSLSSIWILLFFFKATRTMAMQAINIIIECICQMCLLVAVLGLSSNIFIKLLDDLSKASPTNILGAFIGIMIVSAVDILLIDEANKLAGKIASSGSLSSSSELLKAVASNFSIKKVM